MTSTEPEAWGPALYGDPCRECGYEWSTSASEAIGVIVALPDRWRLLLSGSDGTQHAIDSPGLTWSARSYVWHVGDNLRIWAERLVGALDGGQADVPGYDQDLLASAREYEASSLAGALWALDAAARDWVPVVERAIAHGARLRHARRGAQSAEQVAHNNAHDAWHHEHDIRRILASRAQ